MKRALPLLFGLVGLAIGGAIGWALAGHDVNAIGDWRNGAARFIGLTAMLGGGLGYLVTRRLAAGVATTRDGYTLSYRRIAPTADGYRETKQVTIADLVSALRTAGYAPEVEACDALGQPRGTVDLQAPLPGQSFALRDRGVRGWVRVELATPVEGRERALGLIEIWSERGESAGELGLFVLRALDGMIAGLQASRESSRLGEDPAALLVAGVADRPVHRRA